MVIYVASKFENSKVVKEAQKILSQDGHTISHDWTVEDATGKSGDALERYMRVCARKDLKGVEVADALLLFNHAGGCGMFTEFGIALALRKVIVVIDAFVQGKPKNIFFHLPEVHHVVSLREARILFKQVDEELRK